MAILHSPGPENSALHPRQEDPFLATWPEEGRGVYVSEWKAVEKGKEFRFIEYRQCAGLHMLSFNLLKNPEEGNVTSIL
jgi:hypothetical protein